MIADRTGTADTGVADTGAFVAVGVVAVAHPNIKAVCASEMMIIQIDMTKWQNL